MAGTDRPPAETPPASDLATDIRTAGFVRLVGAATGDGLAATAQLASALAAEGVAFQASVAPLGTSRETATTADCRVALDRPDCDADVALGESEPASSEAFAVGTELGASDPVLAAAGVRAAGRQPTGDLAEALAGADCERRPGVGIPTADISDGLVHSTRVHAPFSGDVEAVESLLARADDPDPTDATEAGRRRLASIVALGALQDGGGSHAAESLATLLRPHDGGPFETVEGYADVLAALAETAPGTGIAFALGGADRSALLETWRDHGQRAHAAVRAVEVARYDGSQIADLTDAAIEGEVPLGTVARLVLASLSGEPIVLAVDGDVTVVRSTENGPNLARALATVSSGEIATTPSRARAVGADVEQLRTALKEAT